MPLNSKVKQRYELYDKILVKIVELTNKESITFKELYDALYSINVLNDNFSKGFDFSTLILEDKNQPNEKSLKFILHYFKSLDLIIYDNQFNNIMSTSLGVLKSHETFSQEYENNINKEDLENSLLSNQIETNKKITCLTIILVVIGLFSVVYYIFDVLNMLGYLNTCKALK